MKRKKQKNSFKFQYKIITLTFLLIFNQSTINYVKSEEKLMVTSDSYERIESYFEKQIYSFVFDNNLSNITNLAFAISNDGQNTVLGYCREKEVNLCQTNSPYLFQTKKKCERKFKKKCSLLFKGNFIVIKNKKIRIDRKNDLKKFINFKKNNTKPSRENHSDFEIQSTRKVETCDKPSC